MLMSLYTIKDKQEEPGTIGAIFNGIKVGIEPLALKVIVNNRIVI